MNRRDVILNGVKFAGLTLLAPTLAKASQFSTAFFENQDRTEPLVATLEDITKKAFANITQKDLEGIESMDLLHYHIDKFMANDFSGLTNLKSLTIKSIFHRKDGAVDSNVFQDLKALEVLKLKVNDFTAKLTPELFAPLTNLKLLVLERCRFEQLPESLFTGLPNLESIVIDGQNWYTEVQIYQLKEHFGSRLAIS